jgi:hypothetical protein
LPAQLIASKALQTASQQGHATDGEKRAAADAWSLDCTAFE